MKAVVTAADLPDVADRVENLGKRAMNVRELSANALAPDTVLHRGHAVAAVGTSART